MQLMLPRLRQHAVPATQSTQPPPAKTSAGFASPVKPKSRTPGSTDVIVDVAAVERPHGTKMEDWQLGAWSARTAGGLRGGSTTLFYIGLFAKLQAQSKTVPAPLMQMYPA